MEKKASTPTKVEECYICCEDLKSGVYVLPCGHGVHKECIIEETKSRSEKGLTDV